MMKVYKRALRWGERRHPSAHQQHHRSFGAAVAQLCCDDPEEPINKRQAALVSLIRKSGGPTCREGAAVWAAYGRGDAVRGEHESITVFYTDQRFKRPGTWTYEEAVQHCEPYCYGKLTALHFEVFKTDPCFDDPEEDLVVLNKG